MKFSDETLMAYADGELDAETCRAVEEAMQADPEIAARIAQHRALRSEVGAAFGRVLDEPVPDRLRDAAYASPRSGGGVDLADARARKSNAAARRRWAWKEWSAIAASALMGVLAGRTLLQGPESELVAMSGARLVASGALAEALSNQVGGESLENARVAIAATFMAKSGEYCRAFTADGPERVAGVACRQGEAWFVHTLTQGAAGADGGYRMAESALPPVVAQSVEAMMVGDALDAEQEAAARERGWRD